MRALIAVNSEFQVEDDKISEYEEKLAALDGLFFKSKSYRVFAREGLILLYKDTESAQKSWYLESVGNFMDDHRLHTKENILTSMFMKSMGL